jgi:hypothetical protein
MSSIRVWRTASGPCFIPCRKVEVVKRDTSRVGWGGVGWGGVGWGLIDGGGCRLCWLVVVAGGFKAGLCLSSCCSC